MRKEEAVVSLVEKVIIKNVSNKTSYLNLTTNIWQVEKEFGPISCAVHNIGANIGNLSLLDTTTRVYTKVSSLTD